MLRAGQDGFPTCRVCRLPGAEDLRRRWGCDAPAKKEVFRTSCPKCYGFGVEPLGWFDFDEGTGCGKPCPVCDGSAEVRQYRCPGSVLTAEINEVVGYYIDWKETGQYPAGGGTLHQPCTLYRAFQLLRSEEARIERERLKKKLKPPK